MDALILREDSVGTKYGVGSRDLSGGEDAEEVDEEEVPL